MSMALPWDTAFSRREACQAVEDLMASMSVLNSVQMASDLFYYEPITPPSALPARQSSSTVHSRSTSGSSIYTLDSSPESFVTNHTTPNRSPAYYQHGRTLLPKIRPQDLVHEPASNRGPHRHRKALSSTLNPPGFTPYSSGRPSTYRAAGDPTMLVAPISTASFVGAHHGPGLTSPIAMAPVGSRKRVAHSRNVSASSIDESTLNRYGYPTYRQLPKYVPQCSSTNPVSTAEATYPSYLPLPQEPPVRQSHASAKGPFFISDDTRKAFDATQVTIKDPPVYTSSSTTLVEYLTGPTQAINLVQNVSYNPSRLNQTHFWWDVRNLRRWSSFSLPTLNDIPNFTKLLTTEIPQSLTPPANVSSSRLSPESELALADLIRDIYAPRVNAALRVSQGHDSMTLYPAPDAVSDHENGPHFLANYPTDTETTASGAPRGRVVGLVKSFDRWNTGMRNEQPHRRVEYLNGLSHLQKCMREHSCRYGFIMTEIELVCVRAGCDEGDDVPYFGYLELAPPIATKTSSASYNPLAASSLERTLSSDSYQSSDYSGSSRSASPDQVRSSSGLSGPFTATLALYYLLMLSKAVPLPGQPSWHLNVGGPGALTRQRVLAEGKDKWIPDPQQRERREAKRIRGWVLPQDPWHRREGGGANRAKAAKAKKWHK
ncbi:predicted protein [Uncinocarpus reesii 1704]|uniref:Sialidase n=1 Tax=Uncinocarpus reesii (strain UAMH 1704) TaxID=336963 RepID=C4JZ01_UNCRE|nr:uncharacterized protein UREG_07402 [Uncinocarpus reesii 1704]EEP82537.1 predicted protein [Uncinocarpus reesii 1704]